MIRMLLELLCRHHQPGYLPRNLCALDRGVGEIKAYIIVPAAVEDCPWGGWQHRHRSSPDASEGCLALLSLVFDSYSYLQIYKKYLASCMKSGAYEVVL
jgi:hypothetical protein